MIKLVRWWRCHKQNVTHVKLIHKAIADSDLHPAAVAAAMDMLKYKTPGVKVVQRHKLVTLITRDLRRYVEQSVLGKYAFLVDELLSNLYIGDACPMELYHRIAMAAKVKTHDC